MVPENSLDQPQNQACIRSFKTEWAQAQIDGPMQYISRFDDVAKLLITIGGFVLAVLAGGYSVLLKDLRGQINVAEAKTISISVFAFMLLFFSPRPLSAFSNPTLLLKKY